MISGAFVDDTVEFGINKSAKLIAGRTVGVSLGVGFVYLFIHTCRRGASGHRTKGRRVQLLDSRWQGAYILSIL